MKVLFLNPKHLLESLGGLSKLLCPGLTPNWLTWSETGHCNLLNVSQVTLLCAYYFGSNRPCLIERPLCKSIQWLPVQEILLSPGETLLVVQWVEISRVEARYVTKHPAMHRTRD